MWAETLASSHRWNQVNLVYRLVTLRVYSAYQTISNEAVLAVAGMYSVNILANEMHVRRMEGAQITQECGKVESYYL